MATSVIETLYTLTTVEQVRTIARQIGESESATSQALVGACVALMQRLCQLSVDGALMNRVAMLIHTRAEDDGGDDPANAAGFGAGGFGAGGFGADGTPATGGAYGLRVGRGAALINFTYGPRLQHLVEALAGHAAITQPAARAVIGHAAPMVLRIFGNHLDRLSTAPIPLAPTGFALSDLLADERGAIDRALPGALTGIMAKPPMTARAAPRPVTAAGYGVPTAGSLPKISSTGSSSIRSSSLSAGGSAALQTGGYGVELEAAGLTPPVLIGGLAMLALLWWLFQSGLYSPYTLPGRVTADSALLGRTGDSRISDSRTVDRSGTTPPPISRDGATPPGGTLTNPSRIGSFLGLTRRLLPTNKQIEFADDGVEGRMIALIENRAQPLERTQWFDFDRLHFQTGSSDLTADSRAQVQNIADILTAFPTVRIKIGGYTDNVGNAGANQRLSEARAQRVVTELIATGINAVRLESEGYGEQHPIADNATPEGQARNRRIAVRVLER